MSGLTRRIDKLFTWTCYAAAGALLGIVLGFAIEVYLPGYFQQDMGFHSLAATVFTIYFGGMIAVLALTPFISLIYLISSLFSENSFDQKGLLLSTIAVISSALALILAIDQGVCDRVAGLGGDCLPYKFAYLFDQFSKGGFADVFDIFDFELSIISTSELTGLGKLYTLNFRMISALYLAMLVVALYRRFSRKEIS